MTVIDWFVKLIFWSWLTVWGVALTVIDIALAIKSMSLSKKHAIIPAERKDLL